MGAACFYWAGIAVPILHLDILRKTRRGMLTKEEAKVWFTMNERSEKCVRAVRLMTTRFRLSESLEAMVISRAGPDG